MKVIVKEDRLYPNPANPSETIAVGSAAWYHWLAEHDRFVYQAENRRFSARQEVLRGGAYWYGYRRRSGKLRKVYLGKASDLTLDRLIAADLKLKKREESEAASPQTSPSDFDRSLRTALASAPSTEASAAANIPFSLVTRLIPPALPANLVVRQRLMEQLGSPITLITAPSGFGKTTLLSQWRTRRMRAEGKAPSRGQRMESDPLHPSSSPDT